MLIAAAQEWSVAADFRAERRRRHAITGADVGELAGAAVPVPKTPPSRARGGDFGSHTG
jgi:hypothetical protein